MAIEDAIYSRTAGHAAVVATGAGVYLDQAKESAALPCIIITELPEVRYPCMQGYSAGLVTAHYQFDCYATTRSSVRAMREALRNCWAGLGTTVIGTETIEAVLMPSGRSFLMPPEFGTEDGTRRGVVEIEVWYGESVPTL